jgi:hypothetical protein
MTSNDEHTAGCGILEGKVVALWIVTYDNDPSRAYIFNDFDKTMCAIEGSLRELCPQGFEHTLDESIKAIRAKLNEEAWAPVIMPTSPNSAHMISARRVDLDHLNPAVVCLLKAYKMAEDAGDSELREQIELLFSDPHPLI